MSTERQAPNKMGGKRKTPDGMIAYIALSQHLKNKEAKGQMK